MPADPVGPVDPGRVRPSDDTITGSSRGSHRRGIGLAILVLGVAVLAASIGATIRRERGAAIDHAELRARLLAASAQAAAQPPQVEVAYAQFSAERYQAATGAAASEGDALLGFHVVPNEVEERLRSGQPELQDNLRGLLRRAAVRHPNWAPYGRPFLQARILREQAWVVGLLVSRRDPGSAGTLRLEVDRIVFRDLRSVFDPTEMLPFSVSDFGIDLEQAADDLTDSRREWLEWESRPSGERQFVPLYVLHEFTVPRVSENADVVNETGEPMWLQIVTDVAYLPHRLLFRRLDGQETEIDISTSLNLPLVLSGADPEADQPVASGTP